VKRLAIFALLVASAWAQTAQEVASQLKATAINPQDCYQVRDLTFVREDLKFYLTEGVIAFGKPIGGRIMSAVFTTDVENGDAELLVLPPTRGERSSMAAFTGSPNLDEHFSAAILLFTDDTAEELHRLIAREAYKQSTERGLLLAEKYNSALRNLSLSFGVRFVSHILAGAPAERGFFYSAVQGNKLGNFDVIYEPSSREQIYLGQIRQKDARTFYDTWTSFPARSFRTGQRKEAETPAMLSNFRIEAVLEADLAMKVVTQATVMVNEDRAKVFPVEISNGMKITSVLLNGEEVETFGGDSLRDNLARRNDTEVVLVLPKEPLEKGRAYEVIFEHEGKVVREAAKNVYYVGARGNWYPQSGRHFNRYDITFTYPSALQLVFAGEVKSDTTDGDLRTTRRVTETPIRVAGFNLGKYEKEETTVAGVKVEVYANKDVEPSLVRPAQQLVLSGPSIAPSSSRAPRASTDRTTIILPARVPDPTARLSDMTKDVAAAIEFMQANFGPPALNNLKVAPIPGGFGQGFPGLVYLSTMSYLTEGDRPAAIRNSQSEVFFSDVLLSHEVAHQWWGNLMSPLVPQDDWLMEALANYSALMLLEKKRGTKAASLVLDAYKDRLLRKRDDGSEVDSGGPIALGNRLEPSLGSPDWNAIVYGKGTWVMHMLRRRIGDDNFLKLLGEVARKFRQQTISIRQFQELAATYLPKNSPDPTLDGFFEHWVEGTGIPTLALKSATTGKAPNLKLTLTVTQTGVDENSTIAVPVDVQTAPGKSQTYWLQTGGSEPATLSVPLRTAPLKVSLDPNASVLRR